MAALEEIWPTKKKDGISISTADEVQLWKEVVEFFHDIKSDEEDDDEDEEEEEEDKADKDESLELALDVGWGSGSAAHTGEDAACCD